MARRDKDIISYMYNDTEQQIRERIAKEIEAIKPNHWWGNGKFAQNVIAEAAAIARGNNG